MMDNSELCEQGFLADDGQNGITAVYENCQAYKAYGWCNWSDYDPGYGIMENNNPGNESTFEIFPGK